MSRSLYKWYGICLVTECPDEATNYRVNWHQRFFWRSLPECDTLKMCDSAPDHRSEGWIPQGLHPEERTDRCEAWFGASVVQSTGRHLYPPENYDLMSGNILKSSLVKMLGYRWCGKPAAVIAHSVGARSLSQKISILCNFVPSKVRVELPDQVAKGATFMMYGVGGLDQVARMMWWAGWDGYEKPMPDFFAAISRDARCVLDIGSYTGFFSMIAASCSATSKVYAFEPFPPPRGWLEKNVAINGLGGRIHVVPMAVGEAAGEAELFVPTTETGLMETASSLNAAFREDHLESIKVPVVTLDEFVVAQGCGPIDLMKIDVETMESHVLRGGHRVLTEDRPYIFLEVLLKADPAPLEEIRRDIGYVSGLLHPGGIEWQDRIVASPTHYDHIFCPVEKKDHFEQLAASLGYRQIPVEAR